MKKVNAAGGRCTFGGKTRSLILDTLSLTCLRVSKQKHQVITSHLSAEFEGAVWAGWREGGARQTDTDPLVLT